MFAGSRASKCRYSTLKMLMSKSKSKSCVKAKGIKIAQESVQLTTTNSMATLPTNCQKCPKGELEIL